MPSLAIGKIKETKKIPLVDVGADFGKLGLNLNSYLKQ